MAGSWGWGVTESLTQGLVPTAVSVPDLDSRRPPWAPQSRSGRADQCGPATSCALPQKEVQHHPQAPQEDGPGQKSTFAGPQVRRSSAQAEREDSRRLSLFQTLAVMKRPRLSSPAGEVLTEKEDRGNQELVGRFGRPKSAGSWKAGAEWLPPCTGRCPDETTGEAERWRLRLPAEGAGRDRRQEDSTLRETRYGVDGRVGGARSARVTSSAAPGCFGPALRRGGARLHPAGVCTGANGGRGHVVLHQDGDRDPGRSST